MRVLSPERERDGWHSPHSVLLVVTDDMPFLVDTMRMVLERRGLGIHLLVHPMLTVERDADDELVDVLPDDAAGAGRQLEAWTQIEIDRTDGELAGQVEGRRRRGHRGRPAGGRPTSPPMRDRMADLGDVDPILPWLADGQFVFLGAAEYDVGDGGALTLRDGSELGLAAGDAEGRRARRAVPAADRSSSPAPTTRLRCSAPTAARW